MSEFRKFCWGAPVRPDHLMPTIGLLLKMERMPDERAVAIDAAHRFAKSIMAMLATTHGAEVLKHNNDARCARAEARTVHFLRGRAAIVRAGTASHLLHRVNNPQVMGPTLKAMLDDALAEARVEATHGKTEDR
jgi:hypothetical protein